MKSFPEKLKGECGHSSLKQYISPSQFVWLVLQNCLRQKTLWCTFNMQYLGSETNICEGNEGRFLWFSDLVKVRVDHFFCVGCMETEGGIRELGA